MKAGNAWSSTSDLEVWKAPAIEGLWALGPRFDQGLETRVALKHRLPAQTQPSTLPPAGLPKYSPVLFHSVSQSYAGAAGTEKTAQSLPWRKKETDHHLPCDKSFQRGLTKDRKAC